MSMRPTFAALALLAATAAPASATTVFTFNTTGNSSVNGTYGNARQFSSTVGGTTVKLQATAWQTGSKLKNGNYAVTKAYLGAYSAGLGVTGAGDSSGNNNYHQIDNIGNVDFVLLQFDQAVSLTGIFRNVYSLPNISKSDDDAAFRATSYASPQWNSLIDLTKTEFNKSSLTEILGDGKAGSTSFSSPLYSTQWIVSADVFGTQNDGFKLRSINAVLKPKSAVPEPATWAMMLTGFGLVGASARRQRSTKLAAA